MDLRVGGMAGAGEGEWPPRCRVLECVSSVGEREDGTVLGMLHGSWAMDTVANDVYVWCRRWRTCRTTLLRLNSVSSLLRWSRTFPRTPYRQKRSLRTLHSPPYVFLFEIST